MTAGEQRSQRMLLGPPHPVCQTWVTQGGSPASGGTVACAQRPQFPASRSTTTHSLSFAHARLCEHGRLTQWLACWSRRGQAPTPRQSCATATLPAALQEASVAGRSMGARLPVHDARHALQHAQLCPAWQHASTCGIPHAQAQQQQREPHQYHEPLCARCGRGRAHAFRGHTPIGC